MLLMVCMPLFSDRQCGISEKNISRLTCFTQNSVRFCAHLYNRKWDAVLQRETSIANWVFHSHLWFYKDQWKRSWQHIWASYSQHHVISAKTSPNFFAKYQNLDTPLNRRSGMLYYKERHPVLPERFITFLRCVRMIVSAPDSIMRPL